MTANSTKAAGGSSYAELIYSNITPVDYKEFDGPTGGGTIASAFSGTLQTTALTIYPGQSTPWSLTVGFHATSKGPGTAYNNLLALNTVAIESLSLTDTNGNPVSFSSITSSAGFDYAGASSTATPEPGTFMLLIPGILAPILLRRLLH